MQSFRELLNPSPLFGFLEQLLQDFCLLLFVDGFVGKRFQCLSVFGIFHLTIESGQDEFQLGREIDLGRFGR